jgi:hypothetical protein
MLTNYWNPLFFRLQSDRSRLQVSRPTDFADVCDAWNQRVLPRLAREEPDIYGCLSGENPAGGAPVRPRCAITLLEDDGPWLNNHQTRFHLHVAVGTATPLPRLRRRGVTRLLSHLLTEELRRGTSGSTDTLRECRFRSAVFHFQWHVSGDLTAE